MFDKELVSLRGQWDASLLFRYACCDPTPPCRASGVERSSLEGRGKDRAQWRNRMVNSRRFGACVLAEHTELNTGISMARQSG